MSEQPRTPSLRTADLLRLRMRAQLLSTGSDGPSPAGADGAARIAGVARHMLALQGQDWRSSRWALGVRAPGTRDTDVLRAFDEGLVVRAWPMRGTIHVVPAEDIGWMQRATNHRVLPGAPKRRAFLGLDDRTLDRLVDTTVAALRGGERLSRAAVSDLWTAAGIEWQSAWRYHVLWWMCQNGITTFGPVDGTTQEPRLVLADEWIKHPREVEGDAALAEIAARYATARGAVTAKDLAWWSGLTLREARLGLALATEAEALVPVAVADDPAPYWTAPGALDAADAPIPPWLLLPAFDEHLLGYTGRDAQLDPEHFARIVPGKNGMFLATVVRDGRVVGTWKRGTGASSPIETVPLPGERLSQRGLAAPTAAWQAFAAPEGGA